MHDFKSCRIVITGLGLCTPWGADRDSSWRGMLDGKNAVRWLTAPQWTEVTPLAGAPVCLPEHRPYRHSEPLVELGLTTAAEALADAGLSDGLLKKRTVGVVFGTSKGGLHTFSRLFQESHASNASARSTPTGADSDEWLDVWPDRAASAIGQRIGGYGPVLCPIAACATGLTACQRAAELIQAGDCDIVIAGSADASLQPALLGAFRRLGVLSREASEPQQACRPFDRHRSGFVIGEGAACLVLERLDSALARGARCRAEWLGGRMLSDPYGLTQLDPLGVSLRRLLGDLYSTTGRVPDHINLHGTGTATNDRVESAAIRDLFGDKADLIACTALKGGMGHLLGAAGSVELAATVLALCDQVVPPTVNLSELDPDCRLNLVTGAARPKSLQTAWKMSMGFGGHLAAASLGRFFPD